RLRSSAFGGVWLRRLRVRPPLRYRRRLARLPWRRPAGSSARPAATGPEVWVRSFACPRIYFSFGSFDASCGSLRAKILNIGEGEVRDVIRDALHLLGRHLELPPDCSHQRAGQRVNHDLPQQADRTQTRALVLRRQADHPPDQFEHTVKQWLARLIHKPPEGRSRLRQLMGHDPEAPVWPVPTEQAVQTGA